MRHFILAALSCLSLTAAMPALREAMDERAVQNIIDDLVLHGETVDDLIKRIDPKIYRDEIPNCDEEDPSYHIPKHTGYAVDQGVKLPRDGDNDACTTGTGADHCWTEYFFVESAIEYSSWQDSGSAIDCRGTSMCHSDISQLGQHCVAHMNTHSNGVDWQIVEGKLEYSVPNTQAKVSVGSNVKYQHTDVEGETTTVCRTDSSTR